MKNKVIVTPFFESKYKRLTKKYPHLPFELIKPEKELIVNPKLGEPIGGSLYKIRLASSDKGKGKSGGFRFITYLIQEINSTIEIYLITIYNILKLGRFAKAKLISFSYAALLLI